MPVNQTLAQYSDWSYFTAFALYALALLLFVAYYARRLSALEARAEARAQVGEKVLVGNAPANPYGGDDAASDSSGPNRDTYEANERDSADIAAKFRKAGSVGSMAEMVVYVGVAVHLASVVLRGLSAERFPWGNLYEYISVFSLFAMVIASILLRRNETRIFWPWLLTPVAALMFYGGTSLYAESAPVVPALQSIWFPIHVSTVSIGGGIFLVSGIASLLYLLRIAQPKGKEKGVFGKLAMPLPSAKTLDTIAYRTAIWAFPLFGLGVVFGAIWAEVAWGRFWGWDPKETVSFITWIVYAAYLHARATTGWRNAVAAWINIIGFATMVFNLFFINMVVSGLHSYAGLN
ncbi:c-type cytochrome biogenesis protein CcsB [Corynebacterium hansenii]|uniref:C-type cytochrome biogenesis protein CcsB n=1 Tax=Corynebacterium hansenii TaxID=394964 RepID=A0ABV7ZQ00_9CORY|nr:c-type cytochrome biogenesis protein CcsB [Corynebacterium hansenii]WJY98944.1 Cytochrome c biogenesis protein CcsA [Corynebacterium hansenii]